MRTLDAIFVNSMPDTAAYTILERIVSGRRLLNPSRAEVVQLLEDSDNDLLIFGHGNEWGLYDTNLRDYLIDASNAEQLQRRTVIGIWCFAGNFADRYELHGFFTSMFISNVNESVEMWVPAEEDDIREQFSLFLNRVCVLVENDEPIENWVDSLQRQADLSIPFVRYNYEALSFFE